MNLQQWAESMLDATRRTKTEMCEHDEGPTDLMPTLHVVNDDGESFVALVPDRDYIEIGVNGVAPAPMPLAYIGFCADAYGREYPPGSNVADIQRGELLHRFGLGDMTVTEQLVVTVIDVKTGEMYAIHQRYTYDDTGKPVYAEPDAFGDEYQGQAIDNLRAVAAQRRS